ncbi:MAG: hypothetical protein QW794_08555, partial [Thermosphaera sp.]
TFVNDLKNEFLLEPTMSRITTIQLVDAGNNRTYNIPVTDVSVRSFTNYSELFLRGKFTPDVSGTISKARLITHDGKTYFVSDISVDVVGGREYNVEAKVTVSVSVSATVPPQAGTAYTSTIVHDSVAKKLAGQTPPSIDLYRARYMAGTTTLLLVTLTRDTVNNRAYHLAEYFTSSGSWDKIVVENSTGNAVITVSFEYPIPVTTSDQASLTVNVSLPTGVPP